jgi:hypothetical protein
MRETASSRLLLSTKRSPVRSQGAKMRLDMIATFTTPCCNAWSSIRKSKREFHFGESEYASNSVRAVMLVLPGHSSDTVQKRLWEDPDDPGKLDKCCASRIVRERVIKGFAPCGVGLWDDERRLIKFALLLVSSCSKCWRGVQWLASSLLGVHCMYSDPSHVALGDAWRALNA